MERGVDRLSAEAFLDIALSAYGIAQRSRLGLGLGLGLGQKLHLSESSGRNRSAP
jgi:hypothetical protein